MRPAASLPEHVRRAIALGQGVPRETPAGRLSERARLGSSNENVRRCEHLYIPSAETSVRPRGRSRLQAAWADELDFQRRAGQLLLVLEEPISLRLAERTWYRPDFVVMRSDGGLEVHEVKGHVEDDARAKFKVAAEIHRWATFKWITRARGREGVWTVKRAAVPERLLLGKRGQQEGP